MGWLTKVAKIIWESTLKNKLALESVIVGTVVVLFSSTNATKPKTIKDGKYQTTGFFRESKT